MAPTAQSPDQICLGVITGAHGLAGMVRVRPYTTAPEDVAAYGPLTDAAGERCWQLSVVRRAGDQVLVHIDGIDDRTAAEALKGTSLYVARTCLPELDADEYYHADLVGLTVVMTSASDDEVRFGRVAAVHDYGAGPILDIEGTGRSVLVPFTRAAVPIIDLAKRVLVIEPLPGLFPTEADMNKERAR